MDKLKLHNIKADHKRNTMTEKNFNGIPANRKITDPADVIHVQVNIEFTIVMESNPTTGYSWEPHYNEEVLELIGTDFTSAGSAMGTGGVQIFRFLPKKIAKEKIQMSYKRPWEQKSKGETVYNIWIL